MKIWIIYRKDLRVTHVEQLVKITNGEINAHELAKRELANRGTGTDGDWVGIETAKMKWFELGNMEFAFIRLSKTGEKPFLRQ